jgi:hypothetical protein
MDIFLQKFKYNSKRNKNYSEQQGFRKLNGIPEENWIYFEDNGVIMSFFINQSCCVKILGLKIKFEIKDDWKLNATTPTGVVFEDVYGKLLILKNGKIQCDEFFEAHPSRRCNCDDCYE